MSAAEVQAQSAEESEKLSKEEIAKLLADFPYEFDVVELKFMFVDPVYQRPLTKFVNEVEREFNPALVGTLVTNNRKRGKTPYALIDGQTRWVAMQRREMIVAPVIAYDKLSRADEADLFGLLQSKRRGVLSYHRFRSQIVANNPESMAISRLVADSGYVIGPKSGENITAVAALEKCYRRDAPALERTLLILRAAWRDEIPSSEIIRGLHDFLVKNPDVDDDLVVRRFMTMSPIDLKKASLQLRDVTGVTSGNTMVYMSDAIKARVKRRADV